MGLHPCTPYVLQWTAQKHLRTHHGHQHSENFLKHEFIPVMLDALGLNDQSGVIYEILEHEYFNLKDVGEWDRMMPGMINVIAIF